MYHLLFLLPFSKGITGFPASICVGRCFSVLYVLILILPTEGLAQTSFQRLFQLGMEGSGAALVEMPVGNICVAGFSKEDDASVSKPLLGFFDHNGALLSSFLYSSNAAGDTINRTFTDIEANGSNHLLATYAPIDGYLAQGTSGFMQIEYGSGAIVWDFQMPHGVALTHIIPLSNGFLLTGQKSSTVGNLAAFFMKINQNGQVQWSKTYAANGAVAINACKEDAVGNLYCVGYTKLPNEERNGVMVALSSTGTHIWSRIYKSLTGNDHLVGIVPVVNDKWLLLGTTDGYGANFKSVWATQVDYSGNVFWSKIYAVSDEDYAAFSATALLGGDVLVCVNRPDATFGTKSILLKINSAGDILSNTRYRTFWGEKDVLYEAIPNQSGGLWAVGSANRNGLSDIWLLKTKTDGGIAGCCPSVYDMDQQAVSISSDVISLNPALGAAPFAGTLKEQAQVLMEINACEQVNLNFTLSQDTICMGDCIKVDFPNPTPGIQYSWLFQNGIPSSSNQTQPDGAFCFADEGFVTLKANNVYCGQQDASVRVVFKQNQGQAPNAFSPNGDGLNDSFRPLFNDCPAENYHFQVFNRWGEMVFESLDATKGWDGVSPNGRIAAADIYVWRAAYLAIRDGLKKMVEDNGDVLLLR